MIQNTSQSKNESESQISKQRMRLSAFSPQYVDCSQIISFCFCGRQYSACLGDTLASALVANGVNIFSRSFKYHRLRGPFTMAGNDANTLVQFVGNKHTSSSGIPNILADKVVLNDGDIFDAQNYAGSLEKDRWRFLELLSRFLPVGFYYKTFYKPLLGALDRRKKDSWPLWEPMIRASAGLGVLDLSAKPIRSEKRYVHADVAVVGAGFSGLNIALRCAEKQLKVALVESERKLGGSRLYSQGAEAFIDSSSDNNFAELVDTVLAHPNIEVYSSAVCTGLYEDNFLSIVDASNEAPLLKLRARHCVLATGCLEQHVVFRNNDLPGILLRSAADRLINLYGVQPGNKLVFLTATDDAYYSARHCMHLGISVIAVIDLRTSVFDEPSLLSETKKYLSDSGVSLLASSTVFEAQAGKDLRLSGVEVRDIIGEGQTGENISFFECDTLCVSAGYIPSYHLACQAGAKLISDESGQSFSISSLPKSVSLCGGLAGKYSERDKLNDIDEKLDSIFSIIEPQRFDIEAAPESSIDSLSKSQSQSERDQSDVKTSTEAGLEKVWPIFKHPKGKEFVDFDEDLHIRDIENTTRLGYRDIQLVKRFSTVGMGPSQGKHSALAAARIVASSTERSLAETGVTTARPPLVGEKLAHLAGQCFDPKKRSPLHDVHIELGARMMPAGAWQRPAYYLTSEFGGAIRTGSTAEDHKLRDVCIQNEVKQVRNSLGIIDVSTLGGLDIRGPDAAEFLSRFYTFAFLKQKVGTTRYAVATNENGIVIDDGVACRVGEQYFYVTATTSGVDALYRMMTKWNAQWRLDVDIANVTSAYSAVNIAGPRSREFLQSLSTDIDLSPSAFPYLGYREGYLEGLPVRMLRVGFVGELGYEIHLPSGYVRVLWDLLFVKGENFKLRPFGVEAQRILRLEKGHIIVGQDSDGMSHPAELNLNWAVSRKKTFFVGCKSVDIYKRKPLKRRLIAFVLKSTYTLPKEGQLVFSSKENAETEGSWVAGNVTSCAYSPTMNMHIGLAFAAPEKSNVGDRIFIKVGFDEVVEATITDTPFYDPDNLRNADLAS